MPAGSPAKACPAEASTASRAMMRGFMLVLLGCYGALCASVHTIKSHPSPMGRYVELLLAEGKIKEEGAAAPSSLGNGWHGELLRSRRGKRELAWVLVTCCEAETRGNLVAISGFK